MVIVRIRGVKWDTIKTICWFPNEMAQSPKSPFVVVRKTPFTPNNESIKRALYFAAKRVRASIEKALLPMEPFYICFLKILLWLTGIKDDGGVWYAFWRERESVWFIVCFEKGAEFLRQSFFCFFFPSLQITKKSRENVFSLSFPRMCVE